MKHAVPGLPSFLAPTRPALWFALRVLATALLALVAAILLGLDNPHWAAMTTIVVAQPTRGAAFAKGFYRVIGSLVGAAAGIAILVLLHAWPTALLLALALWVGGCVAAANLLRGFRGYGAVLGAVTGPLVALMSYDQPDAALALGITRIAEVVVGIVTSAVVAAIALPDADRNALLERARTLVADSLDHAVDLLRQNNGDAQPGHRLVNAIATLDEMADQVAAAAPRWQARLPYLRGLLASQLAILAEVRTLDRLRTAGLLDTSLLTTVADALAATRERLRQPDATLAGARTQLDARLAWEPRLSPFTVEIDRSLAALEADFIALAQPTAGAPRGRLTFHRDWAAARIAGLRATVAICLIGALWHLTGWAGGGPMLMSASIMCAIFATHPQPVLGVRGSLLGATLALVAALLFRLMLVPVPAPLTLELALIAPLLLVGLLAVAHRPTVFAGTDFCMMFLFMSEPGSAWTYPPSHLPVTGSGIVLGVAIATLVYAFLLPTDPQRRLRALQQEMWRDLQRLASTAVTPNPPTWRAQALHRVLRLALRAELVGADASVTRRGMASVTVGSALLELRELQAQQALQEAIEPVLVLVKDQKGVDAVVAAHAAATQLASCDDDAALRCRVALLRLASGLQDAAPLAPDANGRGQR